MSATECRVCGEKYPGPTHECLKPQPRLVKRMAEEYGDKAEGKRVYEQRCEHYYQRCDVEEAYAAGLEAGIRLAAEHLESVNEPESGEFVRALLEERAT